VHHITSSCATLVADVFAPYTPWAVGNRRPLHLAPVSLIPVPTGHPVHPPRGLLLALDGHHPDQPAHPFGIRTCLPPLAVSCDRWDMRGLEECEQVCTSLADSLGRNLVGRADGGHGVLLSAKESALVPPRTPLANSATACLLHASLHSLSRRSDILLSLCFFNSSWGVLAPRPQKSAKVWFGD
jgi:hypothetical protein